MAMNEGVFIQREENMFYLRYKPVEKANIPEQPVLEPDDELRRAITIDELREKIHKRIHKLFENK